MTESDTVFSGSIPEIYDEFLVPLIFEQYAADLAERTSAIAPQTVLEIAAGSGVVTRAVSAVLGPDALYTVTDLNKSMLDRARSQHSEDSRIVWRPADALDLPFSDDAFDLVLCQFGVMFFPDRVKAYREARRVLRPGGSFIFNMWDRIEANEFADEVTNTLAAVFSDNQPGFLSRTPHGHYDPTTYRAELAVAGFSKVQVDRISATSSARSPAIPAVAYCQGTPLRNEIEEMAGPDLEEATAIVTEAIRVRFGDGSVHGRIQGFVIAAS